MVAIAAVNRLIVTLAQQTLAAHTDRIAGDLYCEHFLLLDVVVDGAAIYIDDFSGARNSDYLYILSTALTPNLFAEDKRRL
jgi:hypothetical protein